MNYSNFGDFPSLLQALSVYEPTAFVGAFLREMNDAEDEFLVVIKTKGEISVFSVVSSNQVPLPNLTGIFYIAHLYHNEIYDFFGRTTKDFEHHILRLHTHPKDFFPFRKLGKPMVEKKQDFIFTKVEGKGLVEVPVGPIHAGIIPPGHFRFTVDGEDTLNLDTQMGWKHREVESYFTRETNLEKLLCASQEIAGDTAVAYATTFARLIEQASHVTLSPSTSLQRILCLELERIYNHLWTIGALGNDVGQSFLLNGYLSVREELMEVFKAVFGQRTLKSTIAFGDGVSILDPSQLEKIQAVLVKIQKRIKRLAFIQEYSSGVYDRFKDTGIVSKETVILHSGLGLGAKASGLDADHRMYDQDYQANAISFTPILGIQGDSFDRFKVRVDEIFQSYDIVWKVIEKLSALSHSKPQKPKLVLADGLYTSCTEGHRGEIFMMIRVESGRITYFKAKDPSFVNWSLLEYAVLKNIIADFPICNKSFDLSYSGFDL